VRRAPIALESARLRAAGFAHGFSTRALDFRRRPGQTRADLEPQLAALGLALRIDAARLFEVTQVHGAGVATAKGAEPREILGVEADALVATDPGVSVGVRVADCVPVLLADGARGAVAAVHAGWRGFVAGVLEAAVGALRAEGFAPTLAAVGPCIGGCCFEVGDAVAAELDRAAGRSLRSGTSPAGRPLVDLRRGVRAKLAALGVEDTNVEDVGGCTRCDAELWFSHRRDGDAAGRMLGVIAVRA
jgi:YfiH family protein